MGLTLSAEEWRVVMENDSYPWHKPPRRNIGDLWNSELYEGADWSKLDNPKVRSTARSLPTKAVLWPEAKRIHKRNIAAGNRSYHVNAFIHCCTDDQNFDGEREGIWKRWKFFYEVASHFDGILCVDFSTNADFPEPVKRHQFHKMRAIEHGAIRRGIATIPNARWGTKETWGYCFDALPENDVLSVGIVGSGYGNLENRPMFDAGMRKLVELKRPKALVVIGSTNYPIFDEVRDAGVEVFQIDGTTCTYFKSKGADDVQAR